MLLLVACTADSPLPAGDSAVASSEAPPEEAPGGVEALPHDYDAELCQAALDCPAGVTEEVKTECWLSVVSEGGEVHYEGPVGAWVRGRSSRTVPKHQYGVELWDEAGAEVKADLLGMGDESDWILNGQWFDRSLVRNKLGFDLFQSLGGKERYAPELRYCELELDGQYNGVYTLGERIKRDPDRVDVSESATGDSFVLKQDDANCFHDNTTTHGCWKLVYPSENSITEEQARGVESWLYSWEQATLGGDPFGDEGIWDYVDEDSMVDIVLLEEFVKNEDFAWTSLHSWKDAGGKVHFAPWDLDMGYGVFLYYDSYGDPYSWIDYRPDMFAVPGTSDEFRARMATRWAELREGPMATEAILARIDGYQATLGDAIERNFALWPIEDINYGGYFYEVSSYAEEDARVRSWVETRAAFMDERVGDW
ncbi:MAG: CotH kinase family protein [Deltaproteobacteria bacterium]|nr:CotH kinase family protein [Deltaproteobacteria bacterium]